MCLPGKQENQDKKARGNSEPEQKMQDEAAQPHSPQQPSLLMFTLLVMYKNLYVLGVDFLRRVLRAKRRIRRIYVRGKGRTYAFLERVSIFWSRLYSIVTKRVKAPFVRIGDVCEQMRPLIAASKARGKIPLTCYRRIAEAIWSLVWKVLSTLINHLLPLVALWLFLTTVDAYVNQPLGLEVVYNGEVIGYVSNESEYETAVQTLRSRFITTSSTTLEMQVPQFELVAIAPENPVNALADKLIRIRGVEETYTATDELANRMVQASGNAIETAYGLYVDNRFYGAVTDRNFMTTEMRRIIDENSTGNAGERVEFVKKVALRDGLYPESSIISREEMSEIMHRYETVDQYYTVVEGDSPLLIADKTATPYSLLLEINPGMEESLFIGDEILTAVARPFLSVQNVYTIVYNEEFPYETVEIENSTYARGYRNVEQEGIPGIQEVTAEITAINGLETGRAILQTEVIKEPVEERVVVGTTNPQSIQSVSPPNMSGSSATSSTGFIWPSNGGYISVGVGGYPGHSGIDIPRPYGSPVYASASGVVTVAKWTYTGYGVYVMINHGNGYETLYGHNSNLYVSVGDYVTQGQVIAAVGSTGRSYGNHIHFEVRLNGRTQIPQNYVGYSP